MKKQEGAALIVSLVLLTLVALLGVAGVQTISLEEKMAGHSFDRNLAFQAAEAALREAEQYVETNKPTAGFTQWKNATVSLPALAGTPQYFIEYLGNTFKCIDNNSQCSGSVASDPNCTCKRYRITARSNPGPGRASVMLQSVYRTE
jgi:type IV pilus assembly protein PilX